MPTVVLAMMATGYATLASAQETVAGPGSGPPPAATASTGLDEVIVTALRRTENAQKAPVAIDIVSAAEIQRTGVSDPIALTKLVPSIQFAKTSAATVLFYLRGVGSNAVSALTDPALVLSVDGVFSMRASGLNGQFFDLERVEVLKGPQGTLYGRNATGGAVNLITRKPTFNKSAELGVAFGNYNHFETNGVVNVTLSDKVAVRAAFQTIKHDGYLSDGQGDDDSVSGRLQVLAEPSDSVSILLSADAHRREGVGGGNIVNNTGGVSRDQRIGLTDPIAQAIYRSRNLRPLQTSMLYLDGDFHNLRAEVNWTTDMGVLTVIPAYRSSHVKSAAANGSLSTYDDDDDQVSFEARLASRSDSNFLRWVVGGYYSDSNNTTHQRTDNRTANFLGSSSDYRTGTESKAVFADGTIKITETLRALGGVRYTNEKKFIDGEAGSTLPGGVRTKLNRSRTDESVNYRAGFEWDAAPASLVYATLSSGSHSGGFYFTPNNPEFEPEKMIAYTLGSKNRFFENRLQVNLELFRWDFTDQQLTYLARDISGALSTAVVNAGETKIQGAELEVDFKPTRNTVISTQVQYLDAKFIKFEYIASGAPSAGSLCSGVQVSPGNFRTNCEGLRPEKSPKWSINQSLQQKFPLRSGAEITFDVNVHYQTGSYTAITFVPSDYQKAYWIGDVGLTYSSPDSRWSATAYINNFTDETVINNTQHQQVDSSPIRTPRTYGLRLNLQL